MSSSSKTKKNEALRDQLVSEEEVHVLKAMEEIEQKGTVAMIEPLINLYGSTRFDSVKSKASELLSTLKISGAEQPMIAALSNSANRNIRKDILGFIWSSGIQPVNDIALISQIAIDGSFEEALECITLLDSLETAIPEAVLLESIMLVKQHLGNTQKNDKTPLMAQYLMALENMRVEE